MKGFVVLAVLALAASPAAADAPSFELTAGVIHVTDDFGPEVTTGVAYPVRSNVSLGVRLRAFRDHVPDQQLSYAVIDGYNLMGVTLGPSVRIDFAEQRFWLAGALGLADIGQQDLHHGPTTWTVAAAFEARAGVTFARSDAESLAVSLGVTSYVAGLGDARTWSAAVGYQFN